MNSKLVMGYYSKNIWNIGGKRNKNIRNWWMKQKLNQPKSESRNEFKASDSGVS